MLGIFVALKKQFNYQLFWTTTYFLSKVACWTECNARVIFAFNLSSTRGAADVLAGWGNSKEIDSQLFVCEGFLTDIRFGKWSLECLRFLKCGKTRWCCDINSKVVVFIYKLFEVISVNFLCFINKGTPKCYLNCASGIWHKSILFDEFLTRPGQDLLGAK